MDGDADAIHVHRVDVEGRLFVILAQAVEQVVAGGHALCHRGLAERRQGIAEQLGSRLRKICEGLHQRALGFVEVVQHGVKLRFVAVQYSSTW